jgi:hypothetical protein
VTEILLEWHGPFRFQDILADPVARKTYNVPGVYLWVESAPKHSGIYYIGKAGGSPTLMMRHLQHYMCFMGACYGIPARFRNCGKDWSLDIKDPEVVQTIFEKGKLFPLIAESLDYANHLQIFLAQAPKEYLKDIERNLLWDLKPSGTMLGTLSPPKTKVRIAHKNARWADCLSEEDEGRLRFL